MMEKIYLTDNAKNILLSLQKDDNFMPKESDDNDVILLEQEELLHAERTMDGLAYIELTDKGIAYMHVNPKLKNPSIWDDKKYIITTIIAVIALIVSIISLFKEQIILLWNK